MSHQKKIFVGAGSADVTPFTNGSFTGEVDYLALARYIDFQIDNDIDFLVPAGTTGESATLTHTEHKEVVRLTVQKAAGRVPVLAGTGANNTAEAVDLTQSALECGADGVLAVSPYYNKPEARGLLDYYRSIANVGLPVILYDIPGRTARGVPLDVILQLAQEGSIVGIKWASGDFDQLMSIIQRTPHHFTVLSGDDALTLPLMSLGGDGVISVLSNLLPERMHTLVNTIRREGVTPIAQNMHFELLALMRAMFVESNPIPIKTALCLVYGSEFGELYFRSPMQPLRDESLIGLKKVLKEYKLL